MGTIFKFKLKMLANCFKSRSSTWAKLRSFSTQPVMHGTTILTIRKGNQVAMIGDGQVTLGTHIHKPNAKKIRKIGDNVITGFAGATADAMTLYERLENKLEENNGQLLRSCVDLAKAWRTDKYLRQLNATLLVVDKELTLELTGAGDVLEPHDGVMAVGSGGPLALAAAKALMDSDMTAEQIARKSMEVAASIDIYTNGNYMIECLEVEQGEKKHDDVVDAK